MGKLKATKYVVKFDILKAEQIASAQQGFDGATLGQMAGLLGAFSHRVGGARAGAVGGTAVGSVHSNESTGVWLIGMRYKIINAETTEQVATGYTEERWKSARRRNRCWESPNRSRAASDSTRWCSGSSEGRLGNRRQVQVGLRVDPASAASSWRK
jgi:hypothetical protein